MRSYISNSYTFSSVSAFIIKNRAIKAKVNTELETMKTKLIKYISVILVISISNYFVAQTNFSIKVSTVTYQFTETQPELTKLKLSSDGKIAVEPGVIIAYEAYANSNTALKLTQIAILDKASYLAGATSAMIKFKLLKSFKHSFYVALGPTFHYRQSWADMEEYVDEPVYNSNDDWQHKFSWLSGEIEYNYYLNKVTDLSISLNHIQAESIGLAIGVKYWINKKPRKKRGCISCPGLH